jgi:putative beta-lysine N-acetyltransferase
LIELGKLLSNKNEVEKTTIKFPVNLKVRKLDGNDTGHITELNRKVFQSYPFPIDNPGYILDTMKANVRYYGVKKKGKLIALASAEVDCGGANAEMTNFAVLPDYRGMSLAQKLLGKMEKDMKLMGIHTLYTIARLNWPAINRTFVKVDYSYAGTLIRNTHISGNIESMNVFFKHL